jgi:hypothetical protein
MWLRTRGTQLLACNKLKQNYFVQHAFYVTTLKPGGPMNRTLNSDVGVMFQILKKNRYRNADAIVHQRSKTR